MLVVTLDLKLTDLLAVSNIKRASISSGLISQYSGINLHPTVPDMPGLVAALNPDVDRYTYTLQSQGR